jgi:hypothetical protein
MLCFVLRFKRTASAAIQVKTATVAGPENEKPPRNQKKSRSILEVVTILTRWNQPEEVFQHHSQARQGSLDLALPGYQGRGRYQTWQQ